MYLWTILLNKRLGIVEYCVVYMYTYTWRRLIPASENKSLWIACQIYLFIQLALFEN